MIYRTLELTLAPALRVGYRPQDQRGRARAGHRPGDPGRQPRLLRRRVLHPAVRRPPRGLFRQGRVLQHPRAAGTGHGGVLPRLRARAGGARGHPLGRLGHRHRRRGAGRGPGARDLPRGHPLPRRPALQVPHRGRPAGPAQRRAGGARRPGRHPRRAAAGQQAVAPRAGAGQLRRAAGVRAPGRPGAQLAGPARGHRDRARADPGAVGPGVRRRLRRRAPSSPAERLAEYPAEYPAEYRVTAARCPAACAPRDS